MAISTRSGIRRAALVPVLALTFTLAPSTPPQGAAAAGDGAEAAASPAALPAQSGAQSVARGKPVVDAEIRATLDRRRSVPAVITAHRRSDLDAIERLGVHGTRLTTLPMILTDTLSATQLRALERSGLVRSVYANRRFPVTMEDSNWIIGARYAWGPSAPPRFGANGYDGEGVDIAVIDTGIDGKHEDTDNLVEFCDTTAAVNGVRGEVVCAGGNDRDDSDAARLAAFDDEGHGSHVSGTVAGSGDASGGVGANHSTIGVAPAAQLHVYSANVGPVLANFQILAAYDDMIFKKQQGSGVVATSNSFGGGDGANYSPDDPQNVAIKAAYDVGIISVYAAGNSGPEHNTLSDSCINPYAVCVGATTKPDSVVQFSSRGRPSEPADTNRNGVVGDNGNNGTPDNPDDDIAPDVAPDNHDRTLGQKLGIGLYRPTIVAPGVNINSISANAPACKEAADPDTGCYEPLNGTSMATPHVSGAIAVIVDAWRAKNGGRTPGPRTIIDILERSAGAHKLPGYEAEEQGAGRLNVFDAVRYIRGETDLARPNFGTPSPVYVPGKHPGAPGTKVDFSGCTGALSFTVANSNPLDEGADTPPDANTGRFKQHLIQVPKRAERLRVLISWPDHPAANLYVRLWRPGVNPNDEFSTDFSKRAFPDQEAIGLTDTNAILDGRRFLDVRAPQEGTWRLRVYHRAGGTPLPCEDPANSPEPAGYNYDVTTEIPISARVPSVAVTSPAANSVHTDRLVTVRGTAAYPRRWDGVTNYEVPGTGLATGGSGGDPRRELHFQGNTEEGCTGDGSTDLSTASCNNGRGPSLQNKATLSGSDAAAWTVPNPILTLDTERNEFTPNWIWDISRAATLRGDMTVRWWGSCVSCGPTLGSADWILRLYADGEKAFEQRVTATPTGPNEPTLLTATVSLPTITARDRFVLHIEPVYVDSQNGAAISYDSQRSCAGGAGDPCDSMVLMPLVDPDDPSPAQAQNVRVTDVAADSGLRIAWDQSPRATSYEVHRSVKPAFTPSATTLIATTTGSSCNSPTVPSWPSASDAGRCYADASAAPGTTYYYRVVATAGSVKADPSLLAYGTATTFDRQVRVRADRLYGPGYFGFARLLSADGTRWRYALDTLERPVGTPADPYVLRLLVRSFTQGIGSATAVHNVNTVGPAPPTPFDPVVLFEKQAPLTTAAGAEITYRLPYENLGPAPASSATVIDALPAGVHFVSASDGGVFNATRREVRWALGDVAVGASDELVLKVRVARGTAPGTVLVNEAQFRAPLTVATPLGRAVTTTVT